MSETGPKRVRTPKKTTTRIAGIVDAVKALAPYIIDFVRAFRKP